MMFEHVKSYLDLLLKFWFGVALVLVAIILAVLLFLLLDNLSKI